MRTVAWAVIAIMCLALAAGCPPGSMKSGQVKAKLAKAHWIGGAPDFTFALQDGKEQRASDFAGKPLVVYFWEKGNTGAVPEFPGMQDVLAKYQSRFTILALSPSSKGISTGGDFDFVFGHSAQADRLYGVKSLPHSVFIDAEGRIIEQHRGVLTTEDFEIAVKSLLAASPNV